MTARNRKSVRAKPPVAEPPQRDGETPVDYMLRVMRDPKAAPARRDTMAKSATPYVHAKPPPKKKKAARGGEAALKRRLETARETLARKIAQLASE